MRSFVQRGFCAVAVFAAVGMMSANAEAALIVSGGLTLDTNPSLIYQQTSINPCVIGPTNCLNGGFPMTEAGSGGGGSEYNVSSPVYTTAQITGIVGSGPFTIGLDYNQTNTAQTLYEFQATYSGPGGTTTQTFTTDTILQVNNNGEGYSDFLLSGFVIPTGATGVQFRADWFNNDGADRYFLIAGNSPAAPVPEPATMSLFGMGLLAAARRMVRGRK
jgi:hypothetical protein